MENKILLKKILYIIGCSLIAISALSLSIRGYIGDNFFKADSNFLSPAGYVQYPEKDTFNFAIVSDSGSQNQTLQNIINVIRKSNKNFEFILHLGDLATDRPTSHIYWLLSEIKPKLKHIPMYLTPGGHDVHLLNNGNTNKSFYRTIFGQENYWFSYGDVLFISIDTSEEKITEEQITWLKNILNKFRSQYKTCVIFSHVPPIDAAKGGHKLDNNSIEKLKNIIKEYKINTAFFGHQHDFKKAIFGNIPIYVSPSSGQTIRSDIKKYGYIEVEVKNNNIENINVKYIDLKKENENLEIFLIDNFLSTKIRKISLIMFVIGFLLLLLIYYI